MPATGSAGRDPEAETLLGMAEVAQLKAWTYTIPPPLVPLALGSDDAAH